MAGSGACLLGIGRCRCNGNLVRVACLSGRQATSHTMKWRVSVTIQWEERKEKLRAHIQQHIHSIISISLVCCHVCCSKASQATCFGKLPSSAQNRAPTQLKLGTALCAEYLAPFSLKCRPFSPEYKDPSSCSVSLSLSPSSSSSTLLFLAFRLRSDWLQLSAFWVLVELRSLKLNFISEAVSEPLKSDQKKHLLLDFASLSLSSFIPYSLLLPLFFSFNKSNSSETETNCKKPNEKFALKIHSSFRLNSLAWSLKLLPPKRSLAKFIVVALIEATLTLEPATLKVPRELSQLIQCLFANLPSRNLTILPCLSSLQSSVTARAASCRVLAPTFRQQHQQQMAQTDTRITYESRKGDKLARKAMICVI